MDAKEQLINIIMAADEERLAQLEEKIKEFLLAEKIEKLLGLLIG